MKRLIVALAIFTATSVSAETWEFQSEAPKDAPVCVPPPVKPKPKTKKHKPKPKVEQKETVKEVVKEVVVTKEVVVEVEKEANKNAISLIGMDSLTGFKTSVSGNTASIKTYRELDLGLMYQRDFSRIRASAAATFRGAVLLGIGVTF